MKRIKRFITAVLIACFAISSFGCYMISGQKMSKVQGTYKLATYTYIPAYERKEGYTPKTYNYIEDAEYLYEDYLVVTGSGTGYYVHKAVDGVAYSKEVVLSYAYNEEKSSNVEYVIWNDALSKDSDKDGHKLGVAKNGLNYSLPAFDYTQLLTKKPMRSEDLRVRWEKVDDATDLSYAKNRLGELKEYDYEGYGARGIYEWSVATEVETQNAVDTGYQYYFIVIDTANGVTSAKISYALRETPTERVDTTVVFARGTDGWGVMTIDGLIWTADATWGNYYTTVVDGIRRQITNITNDIRDAKLNELIANKLPTV